MKNLREGCEEIVAEVPVLAGLLNRLPDFARELSDLEREVVSARDQIRYSREELDTPTPAVCLHGDLSTFARALEEALVAARVVVTGTEVEAVGE